MSLPSLKQCVGALIIIFIVYAVLTDPTGSSRVAGNLVDFIKDGAHALATFFDGILE